MRNLDYQYLASLVVEVQNGDSNAFAELYAATYQQQYHFALKYLHDEYLAQDALQETYILALKNIRAIKDPKLFIAWLNQISFRVCFKLYEKQKKINTEISEYDNNNSTYRANIEEGPEQHAININQRDYIIRQIMSLPFSESQAILLRFYNNMKIEEIADIMDCSKSTVKRHIVRGQERLKTLIKQ